MNNEQLELLSKAYRNYQIKTIRQFKEATKKLREDGWCVDGPGGYTKKEFIEQIKIDIELANKWDIKIEERELSFKERLRLVNYDKEKFVSIDEWISWYDNQPNEFYYGGVNYSKETALTDLGVPTRATTLTYNNETIESYE
jgi:hypothetical protein